MANLGMMFDANTVAPTTEGSVLLTHEGWMLSEILGSEIKKTKKADSDNRYLEIALRIAEGPDINNIVYARLNMWNDNDKAVEIAYSEFSSICRAAEHPQVQETSVLHGKMIKAKYKVKHDNGYDPATEIGNAYKMASAETPAITPVDMAAIQAASAPTAAGGSLPAGMMGGVSNNTMQQGIDATLANMAQGQATTQPAAVVNPFGGAATAQQTAVVDPNAAVMQPVNTNPAPTAEQIAAQQQQQAVLQQQAQAQALAQQQAAQAAAQAAAQQANPAATAQFDVNNVPAQSWENGVAGNTVAGATGTAAVQQTAAAAQAAPVTAAEATQPVDPNVAAAQAAQAAAAQAAAATTAPATGATPSWQQPV